jgi:hypothetical protein
MPNFGLIKSFEIDDGQLDGLSPQEVFVLGYELADVDRQLKTRKPFSRLIHAENRHRIEASCMDSGREYSINWMEADASETWLMLHVCARTN